MAFVVRDFFKNKCVTSGLGILVLIAGITLILVWWPDVVALFKAMTALGLALAGLVMLYSLSK